MLAETVIMLSSGKLHKDPLLIIRKIQFIKILKRNEPRIDLLVLLGLGCPCADVFAYLHKLLPACDVALY